MRTLVLVICIFLFVGNISLAVAEAYQEPSPRKLMQIWKANYKKSDIYAPGQLRGIAVRNYILSCCKSQDTAVRLLEDSGFQISNVQADAVEISEHYKRSKRQWGEIYPDYVLEDYDLVINTAKQSFEWERLVPVRVNYRINLFLKDKEVSWVTIYVEHSTPVGEYSIWDMIKGR